MSERQQVTAVRVASVPADEFEKAVDAPKPATVTQLAAMAPERRAIPKSKEAGH